MWLLGTRAVAENPTPLNRVEGLFVAAATQDGSAHPPSSHRRPLETLELDLWLALLCKAMWPPTN